MANVLLNVVSDNVLTSSQLEPDGDSGGTLVDQLERTVLSETSTSNLDHTDLSEDAEGQSTPDNEESQLDERIASIHKLINRCLGTNYDCFAESIYALQCSSDEVNSSWNHLNEWKNDVMSKVKSIYLKIFDLIKDACNVVSVGKHSEGGCGWAAATYVSTAKFKNLLEKSELENLEFISGAYTMDINFALEQLHGLIRERVAEEESKLNDLEYLRECHEGLAPDGWLYELVIDYEQLVMQKKENADKRREELIQKGAGMKEKVKEMKRINAELAKKNEKLRKEERKLMRKLKMLQKKKA